VSNCREIPALVGLSVAGAKAAWVQAGFLIENAHEPGGAVATDTVATATVTPPPDAEFCPSGQAFFSSSLSITVQAPGERTSDTCLALPNVRGMSVAAARTAWGSSGFTGSFTPATDHDANIVIEQTATPSAGPGDCVEPDTSLAVAYGAPPPAPPPPPCKVPSFVNTSTTTASATWTTAGFTAAKLTFKQRTPYTIKAQTLVGGTWVSCASSIVLSRN
jgi:beta-lactam-binding protein with PASTA domain